MRKVDDDEPPPFQEAFSLAVPEGFTFVGRYAVAPARLGTGVSGAVIPADATSRSTPTSGAGAPTCCCSTRAPPRARPPRSIRTSASATVDLGPLGQAELAVDLRTGEVRLTRPDGGFVRLSGTIPLDELVTPGSVAPRAPGGSMSSARTLAAHLRRYPWWYGVAAVWLVGMLALPIVRGSALADVFAGGQPAAPGVTAAGRVDPGPGPRRRGRSRLQRRPGRHGRHRATTSPWTPWPPTTRRTLPARSTSCRPEILDAIFDALPPFAFPALPDEIAPIANAVAPVAATGCSGLGLAGVVIAVAAQTVDGVPFDRILPYLAPASTACAASRSRRSTRCARSTSR